MNAPLSSGQRADVAEARLTNISPEEELRALLLGPEQRDIGRLRTDLDGLSGRFESPEKMAAEVSVVLNEALRRTAPADRTRLTDTLALLITQPVRQEIKNAQPEIMEALYPVADDLVAKGVRNAVDKLNSNMQAQMRARLTLIESLSVRVEALATRRTVTEVWVTRYPPKPEIDLMLVDRQSGLPIAAAGAQDENAQLERTGIASMLGILETFAADSLNAGEPVALERFETDNALFLTEGSPSLMLVARVRGGFPAERDEVFARQFKTLQRDWHTRLSAAPQLEEADHTRLVDTLNDIRTLLIEGPLTVDPILAAKRTSRRRALVSATALAGLCLVLLSAYDFTMERRLDRQLAQANLPAAYPLHSEYRLLSGSVHITGLVRQPDDRTALLKRLRGAFKRERLMADVSAVGEL